MNNTNLKEQVALLADTAEFLGDKTYTVQLDRLRASLESGTYMLSVMGQFSAGKSRLINSLLEKDVLPVHITETTALITFICYGEDEHAELLMNDGTAQRLSLEETLELWQNGAESSKLENITTLNLFVNSNLLKNGLIIADTPGINTIVKEHVSLAADVVGRSDSILYVMGKSVTETDLNFIRGIISDGLNITFVRTHMDALKEHEEDAELTIAQERKTLSEFTSNTVFFVSNEKDSSYYSGINELRNWMMERLAVDAASAAEENARLRVGILAQKFREQLHDRSNALSTLLDGGKEKFALEKSKIEHSLDEMESILSSNKKRLKGKMEQAKRNAETDISENCEAISRNISRALEDISGTDYATYIQQTQALVTRGCATLRNDYRHYFDRIIADNTNALGEELSGVEEIIQIDTDVPESLEEAEYEFSEISEEKSALAAICTELQAEIEQTSADIERAQSNESELLERRDVLRSAMNSAMDALASYPDYERQYVEVQQATHTAERGWRTVGKILDWATLLIPGDLIAQGASKVLQLGSKAASAGKGIAEAGKVAQALDKGAKLLNNGSKAAKMIDAGIDVGKIIRLEGNSRGEKIRQGKARKKKEREIQRKAEQAKEYYEGYKQVRGKLNELKEDEDTASFLDYLTIEHWFGKIGKHFDQPQQLAIDHEYEERYYRQRSELQQQAEKAAREDSQNTAKLLDIRDEKEQSRLYQEKLKKQLASKDARFAELSRNEEIERRKAQEKAIRAYYSSEAYKALRRYCEHLLTEGAGEIDELIECYIASYDYSICRQINRKRAELDTLEEAFNSESKEKQESELSACSKYIEALDNILANEEH